MAACSAAAARSAESTEQCLREPSIDLGTDKKLTEPHALSAKLGDVEDDRLRVQAAWHDHASRQNV
jgi:hypothetical protein